MLQADNGTIVEILDEDNDVVYDDFMEQYMGINTDLFNVTTEQLNQVRVIQ